MAEATGLGEPELREKIIRDMGLDLTKEEDRNTLEATLRGATAPGVVLGKDIKDPGPQGAVYGGVGVGKKMEGAQTQIEPTGIKYVEEINKAKGGA